MGKKGRSKKRKEEVSFEFRYFAEIFIFMLLLGIVFVNGLYLDGYYYSEAGYEYGNLVVSSEGYTVQDNTFQYTGSENSYVQLYCMDNIDQVIFTFTEKAESDCNATLFYLDQEGNVLQKSSQGVWEKGDYTLKMDLIPGSYNSYLLSLPANFTLQKAYYAFEKRGTSKSGLYFAVSMIALIFAMCFVCVEFTRKWIRRLEEKVVQAFYFIQNSFSWKRIGVFAGIVVACLFLSGIFALQGFCRYSSRMAFAVLLFGVLIATLVVNYKNLGKKIEWIGFLVILLTGSVFSFTEPANVGVSWDDEVHFQNAVRLSHFFDHDISAADMTVINEYTKVALEKMNYGRAEQTRYNCIMDELENSRYYVGMDEYKVNNISIAYLPSAIGLAVGRGIGLPFHVVLDLGRWMNVLLLAVLSYFAMKRLRSGKIIVVMIALIPTNIFIAGNFTYDTWLFAWSILGLSAFFGEWQRPDEKMGKKTPWLISIAMFLAVLPKQVYFPLTCIALFMPKNKFESTKQAWLYRGLIFAAICLPFLNVLVNNLSSNAGEKADTRSQENVSTVGQLQFVRENPAQVLQVMYNYLKSYLNPFVFGKEYITSMAYFGYLTISEKFYIFLILIGAFLSQKENISLPWWSKLGVVFVYIVIGAAAAFSMYVCFTGVGSNTVNGCQGRYLLPTIFPLVYVVTRFSLLAKVKNVLREENINFVMIVLLVSTVFLGLWQGCLSYY